MSQLVRLSLALFTSVFIFGCEDAEDANLYKAQACLNNATSATANDCLAPIEGLTSERSYIIRCSVAFLAEGIDEVAIVTALENINGEEGGDPTSATIASLAMSTTDAATSAVSACNQTGSQALSALAGFAQISTILGEALGGFPTDPTAAQIEALIDSYDPNSGAATANKEDLGNAVIASQDNLCNATDGLLKDSPACTDINQAIAANPGDPNAVADALIGNIDNQSN